MQENMKQDTTEAEAAGQDRPEEGKAEAAGEDRQEATEADVSGQDHPAAQGNGSVPQDGSDIAETLDGIATDDAQDEPDDGTVSALGELTESMDRSLEAVKDGSNPGATSMIEGIIARWNRLAAALGIESVEELKAQANEYKDQWMRALAEAQNVRKRAEREKSEMSKYGAARFARDVLPVRDGLKRALEVVGEEERKNAGALVEGIELTLLEFTNSLSRNGIEQIAPEQGGSFDPNFHEAMINAPSEEIEKGKIIQVFEEGFMLHDRLLRPAKVMVSTGAPKAVAVEGGPRAAPKPKPEASADGPGSDAEIDVPDMGDGGE